MYNSNIGRYTRLKCQQKYNPLKERAFDLAAMPVGKGVGTP